MYLAGVIAPEIPGAVQGHISETWGSGRRFGIMPMGQGRVCWYATRNSTRLQSDGPEGRKAAVTALFKAWHGPIPEMIEATNSGEIIKNDARDPNAAQKMERRTRYFVG